MSINIQKRTRTLTGDIYSEWSEWSNVTTMPPYVNSDIIEYRLEKKEVDTVAIGALYDELEKKAVGTLDTLLNKFNITSKDKASAIAGTINNLLQTSAAMVQKQPLIDQEVEEKMQGQASRVANLAKQGLLLDAQISKLTKEELQTIAQTNAITQQVIDNRRIKIISVMGDCYGTVSAGGSTVSADMWKTWFDKISALETTATPQSVAITKVT